MNHFFFNDGRNHRKTNSNDGQKLLSGKPFECHKTFSPMNHLSHGITLTHGISGIQNVLHRASAIYRASASIYSERKRAVYKNSLTYVKGWGKLIAYAIISTAERMRGWYQRSLRKQILNNGGNVYDRSYIKCVASRLAKRRNASY